MSDTELLQRFKACTRYKNAKAWQKPWIDPGRFARNQLRKRGIGSGAVGGLRSVRTFHLSEFTVVNGENVSEHIGSYGVYEDSLTEAFLHLVRPGQVVIDIGMHLGYYTTLFARLVGETGAVHAFEPTPSTREIATRNVSRFPQVRIHPEAVWRCMETLSFHDYGVRWMAFNSFTAAKEQGGPEPRVFDVQTITLDDFRGGLGRAVHVVKIDAESAEESILAGAGKLLKQDGPVVSMEVGDAEGQGASRQAVDALLAHDYRVWEFSGGKFAPHVLRERYAYDNLIFAPAKRDLSSL
jgi:FkbM family methyltransferase